MIEKEKRKELNRYGNAIKNKAKRDYCFAYLSYLENGACGNEPERNGLSVMGAQAVRIQINSMNPWG